jgi:hypothetical protein
MKENKNWITSKEIFWKKMAYTFLENRLLRFNLSNQLARRLVGVKNRLGR